MFETEFLRFGGIGWEGGEEGGGVEVEGGELLGVDGERHIVVEFVYGYRKSDVL